MNIDQDIKKASSIAILGHVRPDGDCVGSSLALYHYIQTYFPGKEVKVYLDEFLESFHILKDWDKIEHDFSEDKAYDLCFSLDSGDKQRHGETVKYFDGAKKTIVIDHHISNTGFSPNCYIVPTASSTAELIAKLIGREKYTKTIAECLYLGLVHDTGVFQYSNTTPESMRIGADLMETGIDISRIIDETFYQKTYVQNQVLGRTLMESMMLLDGKCIVGLVRIKDMNFYGVTPKELDGIVSQLRYTKGVEVALFLYETEPQQYKVSMRSNGKVNVSEIAVYFGGGGHVKAAGCEMSGNFYDVVNNLTLHIETQLKEE